MAEKGDTGKKGRERRRFERASVLWSGSLVCSDQVYPCVIVNVSVAGALVRCEEAAKCRPPVALRSTRFGDIACEISWRKDQELGLRFLDRPEAVAERIGEALK